MSIYVILILIIIILFIFLNRFLKQRYIENFDQFSPYMGNLQYPYIYQKNIDQIMLKEKLKEWETPFNMNNEGYYNKRNTPFVYISSYIDMKDKLFNVYS